MEYQFSGLVSLHADCVQVIGSKFVLYLQKKKDSAYADLLK